MKKLHIKNSAHAGYRRAGVILKKGDNEFSASDFTNDQFEALNADPRLTVLVEDEPEPDAPPAADTSPVASEPVAATDEQNTVAATETTSTTVPAAKKPTARASKAKEQ